MEFTKSSVPNMMKIIAVTVFTYSSGVFLSIASPMAIPIPVMIVNASMTPINTGIGALYWAASAITIICVLSPSSIKETRVNVDKIVS